MPRSVGCLSSSKFRTGVPFSLGPTRVTRGDTSGTVGRDSYRKGRDHT